MGAAPRLRFHPEADHGYANCSHPTMLSPMNHSQTAPADAAAADAAAEDEFSRLLTALHAQRPLRHPELREAQRALDRRPISPNSCSRRSCAGGRTMWMR